MRSNQVYQEAVRRGLEQHEGQGRVAYCFVPCGVCQHVIGSDLAARIGREWFHVLPEDCNRELSRCIKGQHGEHPRCPFKPRSIVVALHREVLEERAAEVRAFFERQGIKA